MAWAEKYEAEKALKLKGSYTKADVMAAYRIYVKTSHPDIGGDHDEMIAVNKAKDFMIRVLFKDEPADRAFTCETSKDSKKKASSSAASTKSATTASAEEYVVVPPRSAYDPIDVPEPEEAWWEKSAEVDTPVDPEWEAAFNKYCSEFFTDSSDTPKPDPEPDPAQSTPADSPQWSQETRSSDSFESFHTVDEAIYEAYADAPNLKHREKNSPIYRFANFMVDGFPWKVLFAIACLALFFYLYFTWEDSFDAWMMVFSFAALVLNTMFGVFTGILKLPFRLIRWLLAKV